MYGGDCAGGVNHGCEDLSQTCNDRANVTDRELDRLAEHVRGIRTSLGMLGNIGRLSLKGQAWDSARSYVEEVELPYLNTKLQWIEAMNMEMPDSEVRPSVFLGSTVWIRNLIIGRIVWTANMTESIPEVR
jgi:hypothetical protein